ncbi:MAG: TetR/AcrR family transcriptional regulator [Campylobacterota bacterium]|nr:TetR/AcrR family transcriptional regulator [Campylobacterota bacterium]
MSTKREDIIKTAMRLFTEEGFHATPTSKIAKEANVATGTLFHHFKNKEALINALYIYVKKRLCEALKGKLDSSTDTKSILFQLWKNSVHWFNDHYNEFVFLLQYQHSIIIIESTHELLYNDFTDIINQFQIAIDRDELKSNDLEYIVSNFVANVQQNSIYFHKHPDTFSDEAIARHFEIYYSGLSATQE